MGLKNTDEIVAIDDKKPNLKEIKSFVQYVESIKEGQDLTITILRNGNKMDLKGKAQLEKSTSEKLVFKAHPTNEEQKLQNQWLTGQK